jgi:aspartate carbamoyltransferase catalytic subunit
MKDIISINDFSKSDILEILRLAKEMEDNSNQMILDDFVLGTLFYEPSTRTRLSFEAAMQRLHGRVIGFADSNTSSVSKGESLVDTIRIVEQYCDIIVIRHPTEGAARLAAETASIPVINAGDGSNQHPTQTLIDLYTILKSRGSLDNLNIGFVGDLKYGRTVHSLATALSLFDSKMSFIAPEDLQIPKDYLDMHNNGEYRKSESLSEIMPSLDILYVTRIQKERFQDPMEYERFKGIYRIDRQSLLHAKKSLKIMHPLPRVDEISTEIDLTDHALYFEQAKNGIPVRQALLRLLLKK